MTPIIFTRGFKVDDLSPILTNMEVNFLLFLVSLAIADY
ncbi:hypothetical protein D082_40030 (plasmid) [Synechocystis sp. PCC 6714]|nr:hypothetical protein D082_40030 [Synechocystis sp. PCC 6714]